MRDLETVRQTLVSDDSASLDSAPVLEGGQHILLAGATGLVGAEILSILLADPSVAKVHTVGRRPPAQAHAKLLHHSSDLRTLPVLPALDAAYIALGTTIKVAGSQAAFRAVDHDAVLAVARAAQRAGARRLGVVSAMGADAQSSVFYNRVKGEVEAALSAMEFRCLVLARPALLLGDRARLQQPERAGERWGAVLSHWLRPLIPLNYRSIQAQHVAQALVQQMRNAGSGQFVLLSGQMQPKQTRQ